MRPIGFVQEEGGEFLEGERLVGGWVGGWVEEDEAVGVRCCGLGLGGWVGRREKTSLLCGWT